MPDAPGPWGSLPPEPPRKPARRRPLWAGILGVLAAVGLLLALLVRFNPQRTLSGADWINISRLVLILVVVSAGVASRRHDIKQTLRHGLIWLGVIAALLALFSSRDQIARLGQRIRAELTPESALATGPHEVAVVRSTDDNFYVVGLVNGAPVRFLVDTGASEIVLSPADARRLGVDTAALTYGGAYETANGVGHGAPFRADSLEVGDIHLTDVAMSINQAPMRTSLLGMTFFKRLESFEVRGSRLYMRWRP